METRTTDKFSLRTTIRFLTMTTHIASSACVTWVNSCEGNAVQLRLVGYKLFKLVKRPVGMFSPLGLTQPFFFLTNLFRNSFQIFHTDSARSCLSLQYNGLGNAVVRTPLKQFLPTGKFFKSAFSRLSANALQNCPTLSVPLAGLFNSRTTKGLSVTVGSDRDNAQINSQHIIKLVGRFVGYVTGQQKEVLTLNQHQIRLSFLESKQTLIMAISRVRDFQSTVDRPDRGNGFFYIDRENTRIVGDTARSLECSLSFPIQLVAIGYFGQATNNQLGTQIERFLNRVVLGFVKIILLKRLMFKSIHGQCIASRVRFQKRIAECGSLLSRCSKVYFSSNLHTYTTLHTVEVYRPLRRPGLCYAQFNSSPA